ncbi:MAG: YicC family protein [Gammaproteobacteria bacterium]|nr:YicC family protein [Gammaproteobacteria bacterium]
MIYSMTAFARQEARGDWGSAAFELRSVNQRFLEPSFRLPEALRGLEGGLRERLRNRLTRGKLECSLRFEAGTATADTLKVNTPLALAVVNAATEIADLCERAAPINPLEVLRWPGVLESAETDKDALEAEILALFEQVLDELLAMRAREGEVLAGLIHERLTGIRAEVAKVRGLMPEILRWQRERLVNAFTEAKLELDAQRLEQEMVMLAQRIDVAEELDRLETHVKEVERTLKAGGAVGRRLDFLMQELNREANTLGSKSINTETTGVSVNLKVLIEQMREQVQNLE